MNKELLELCQLIISASLHWTGEDEEKNPQLKKIRTLAGFYLRNLSEVEKMMINQTQNNVTTLLSWGL